MSTLLPDDTSSTDQISCKGQKNICKKSLTVRCPECGSIQIGEVERALVTMEVKSFTRDLFGTLCAEEYTGDPLPDWQTSEPVDFPFQCLTCKAELTEEDLLIEETTMAEVTS